jgi:Ca2+-binding RTX toxin-like protein
VNGITAGAFDLFNSKYGTSGTIFTGTGHDTVLLGKGSASVHIDEAGNSTLTAGAGHDKFIFDEGLGGGKILIKHFNPLIDKIELSETFFHGLGALGLLQPSHFGIDGNAHNHHPQIVYNDLNGFLFYDSNGDLPGGRTHFATLAGHPTISDGNFILHA